MKRIFILLLFIFSCKKIVQNKNIHGKDIQINKVDTTKSSIKIKKGENFVNKCDIKIVADVKKALSSNIDNYDIVSFLKTISPECKNNVEFNEFANKVLFDVIDNNPLIFLESLNNDDIIKDEVFKMIENPVNDNIDLTRLLTKIKRATINSSNKKKLIKSLTISLNKSK